MDMNLPGQLFPLVGEQDSDSFRRDAKQLADFVLAQQELIAAQAKRIDDLILRVEELVILTDEEKRRLDEIEINLPPSKDDGETDQQNLDLYSLALINGVFQGSELDFLKTILKENRPISQKPIFDKVRELVERVAADVTLGAGETTITIEAVRRIANAQASAVLQLKAEVKELDNGVIANAEAILAAVAQIGNVEGNLEGQLAAMAIAVIALESEVEVIDGKVEANASAIIEVDAEVVDQGNRLSGGGLLQITGNASPGGGVHAEVTIGARASAWGADSIAATTYQAYTEGGVIKTRVINYADRFIFASQFGDYTIAPITFTGSQAYMRDVIATRIQVQSAPSGQRLVITDSLIAVYDAAGQLRVRMGIW